MTDSQPQTGDQLWKKYLTGRLTRGQLLKAATAGIAVAAVPGVALADTGSTGFSFSFPFYPKVEGTYTPESIPDILDNLVTMSYFATSGVSVLLASPQQYGLTGLGLSLVQAVAAEEQYHIDFLTSLGASPVTTSFTAPPAILGSAQAALAASEISATIQTAAFMTGVREFAEQGQPELAKWAYQTGAQEAEQRVTFRFLQVLAGVTTAAPPINKAFETDLFLYTRDAIGAYRALGLIGGSGTPFSYPGRDAILAAAGPMAAAVQQKVPNNAGSSVAITGPESFTGERP